MLFSSTIFLFLFLPAVLFCYYVLFKKSRLLQNILLTAASLLFYAWGEPKFVFVMIGSILANWFFALLIDKNRGSKTVSRLFIVLTLCVNFGIMFIFKYLMFTLENVNSLFGTSIAVPQIVLPIGISFFTFQAVSYVIDVYRKDGELQKNPLNVALYISFFPQLIAGPIVRYQTVADQIKHRKESFSDFSQGVCRFIIGLSKKLLLANVMAIIADQTFGSGANSVVTAWVGALAYTFQIYFDFSGYSDMAIGLGKMFGFHFLENFDYPYISSSITEFWRRWHISLGTWFRDYVYFPMGGSRVKSKGRLVFNLFVVWLLTGIWHGANWTFIVWGLMYFLLLALEKMTGFAKKLGRFSHIYTMLFVILGWVIFRAESLGEAITYIGNMFGVGGAGFFDDTAYFLLAENRFALVFAAIFSLPVTKWLHSKFDGKKIAAVVYPVAILSLLVISVTYLVKGGYNPFIYFNF